MADKSARGSHNRCLLAEFWEAAVYSRSSKLHRFTVQRNKLHNPTYSSNSWKEYNCSGQTYHPQGPQGISLFNSQGEAVIRYNEIYSDSTHHFNDSMGETNNFSDAGFPNKDTDIYGNLIRDCWDDGLELEGADKNVPVWGNYIDETYVKVAMAAVIRGPIYVWHNVMNVSRTSPTASYGRGTIKSRNYGDEAGTDWGGGRVYLFNNTTLIPSSGSAVAGFISEYDQKNNIENYRVFNNVIQLSDPSKKYCVQETYAHNSVFDYDICSGKQNFSSAQEQHGVLSKPVFAGSAVSNESTKSGDFSLAPNSAGYHAGKILPNFTDGFSGVAPDAGAQPSQSAPMQFGVNAYK